jgi:ubiquitin-like protein ATG12
VDLIIGCEIVTIFFYPLRDAPGLRQTRFKIKSSQPFGAVVTFLRKKLGVKERDGLWCYIDNFAPAPDEGVGGLYNVSPSH